MTGKNRNNDEKKTKRNEQIIYGRNCREKKKKIINQRKKKININQRKKYTGN